MKKDYRMKNNHVNIIIVTIILLGGLLLRLYGINFGLPYLYSADELDFVSRATRILANQDLNPHWFGHPGTTVMYMLSGLYSVIYLGGASIGIFKNIGDFKTLYFQDPTLFYLSGRIMFALFGVMTILLIYMIACRLFNKTTGLIAAILLAFNPLHIYHSKLIRPDILFTFLILLVFWFCLEIHKNKSWKSFILAGFILGLSISTKYPAITVALVIIAAYIFNFSWNDFPKLIGSGAASFIGIFVGSPFLFLDFKTVLSDVITEARPVHIGATGNGFIQNFLWYIQVPVADSLSLLGLILAIIGIFLCIISKKKENWLLLIFPITFLLFIIFLNLRWARWVIPIIPFLCILAARSFYWLVTWIGQKLNLRLGNLLGCILLIVIIVPLVNTNILYGIEMSGKDTRTLALEWIIEHIPKQSRLLLEKYTPHLPKDQFTFLLVENNGKLIEVNPEEINHAVFRPPFNQIGKLKKIKDIRDKNVEYIIFSDWYNRYKAESKRFPEYKKIVRMYNNLMKIGTKIYEIKPTPGKNQGPIIQVYHIDKKN